MIWLGKRIKLNRMDGIVMSQKQATDVGTVYFYNMTTLNLKVTVNDSSSDSRLCIDAMGQTPPYVFNSKTILRSYDPKPYQRSIFGIENTIEYVLGDAGPKRTVILGVDCNSYLINRNIQIYVFFDSVVVNLGSKANEYKVNFASPA